MTVSDQDARTTKSWREPAPTSRRVVRLVPVQSTEWVLLRVMRAALDPSWTPDLAAKRLVDDLRAEPHRRELLTAAVGRLRRGAGMGRTLHHARALATLNMALHHLDSAQSPSDA